MATQNARVDRMQPYNHPAYDKPRRVSADNRRQREQSNKRTNRPQSQSTAKTRPTTDQIFNAQYQETGKGQGANTSRPDRTQNSQTTYRSSNAPVRSAQSTDEIFNESYANAGVQPANENRAPDQTSKARTTYAAPTNVPRVPRISTSRIPKIKRKKKSSVTKMALARVRVTTANTWIASWAMFWYLTFQLPFAMIGAAGLGMGYAAMIAAESIKKIPLIGSALYEIGEFTLKFSSDIIAGAFKLFGINFDPILLFITPFALVFLLGLFQLILTWFLYMTMRINSLSGKAGGIKGLMFMFAGVGYAIPILNMFPLIFLWIAVVWIHPK